MAHPNLKDSRLGHDAKLRSMTRDYGAASGPANNIPAPTNKLKQEGEEDSVGFGADTSQPRARADRGARVSRRTTAANPVATYAAGGVVGRAAGGRTRKGGKGKGTHVNVIVAPQGAPDKVAAVPPVGGPMPPMPPMPPKPPLGAAGPNGPMGPGPGPGPAGLPMAPGAPGGIPPGLLPPRADGGAVHKDAAEDKALIQKTLRDEGLVRRARGGKISVPSHMTAGAATGLGRLEKIEMHNRKGSHEKPQAV